MSVELWIKAPSLLQNIMFVTAINHRLLRSNAHPSSSAELLEYRGEALAQLREQLETPSKTTTAFALVAVLMVLQAEIQLSAVSQWQIHLEAAWGIITQVGGLAASWKMFPRLQPLLALFLQENIMSMTTVPTEILVQMPPEFFYVQLEDLESLERHILTTCCPFPPPVLGVIARVNLARYALASGNMLAKDGLIEVIEGIGRLQSFNAADWASDIVETQLPAIGAWDPRISKEAAIAEWTHHGACYQSASVMYCIRSLQSLIDSTQSVVSQDLAVSQSSLNRLVESQRQLLQINLKQLLDESNCEQKATKTMNMGHFVLWPLFIDSYELLGWSSHQAQGSGAFIYSDLAKAHVNRLLGLGTKLGQRSFFDAANQLQIVAERRQQRPEWKWDDGFDNRCIFLI